MADNKKKDKVTDKDRAELLGEGAARKAAESIMARQRSIDEIIRAATDGTPPPEPDRVKKKKKKKKD